MSSLEWKDAPDGPGEYLVVAPGQSKYFGGRMGRRTIIEKDGRLGWMCLDDQFFDIESSQLPRRYFGPIPDYLTQEAV